MLDKKRWTGGYTLTSHVGCIPQITALVNLTPHELEIRSWDRGIPACLTVPSHGVARVEENEQEGPSPFCLVDYGFGGDVPFPGQMLDLGAVVGLPDGEHFVTLEGLLEEEKQKTHEAAFARGMPREHEGPWPVQFIVSMPTLMALAAQGVKRSDVWAPGRPIRDAAGKQVAAMGLRRLK